MNAALDAIINRIYTDEFRETEIVIISETDVFSHDDLAALEAAIETNEWVRDNLKILQLLPNNITRGYYVNFKHSVNWARVSTKAELVEVIEKLNSNNFHYSNISFGDNRSSTGIAELDDNDLQELVTAVNASEWCQKYLIEIVLDHAHVTRLPAIKCTNLREIRIYANPIDEIEELACPNLEHIVAHYIGKFDMQALKLCTNMEQIDAFGSNLRVPPNVMNYPKMQSLNILSGSPFSSLGFYALLLMQQKKKLEIDDFNGRDLKKKFVAVFSQHKEASLPEDFHDHGLYYWDIKNPSDIDQDKFIDEFEIPIHFFDEQVGRIISFMNKIYYIELPLEVSEDGRITVDPNIRPNSFHSSTKLNTLNAQYREARGILFATIEGFLERQRQIGDIEADSILSAAEEKTADYLRNLESHTDFLVSELYADFETLQSIFNDVDKPQHAESVHTYVTDNSEKWANILDVKQRLLKSGREHFKALRDKAAESAVLTESTPKVKNLEEEAHEAESPKKQKTENSSNTCRIS